LSFNSGETEIQWNQGTWQVTGRPRAGQHLPSEPPGFVGYATSLK